MSTPTTPPTQTMSSSHDILLLLSSNNVDNTPVPAKQSAPHNSTAGMQPPRHIELSSPSSFPSPAQHQDKSITMDHDEDYKHAVLEAEGTPSHCNSASIMCLLESMVEIALPSLSKTGQTRLFKALQQESTYSQNFPALKMSDDHYNLCQAVDVVAGEFID